MKFVIDKMCDGKTIKEFLRENSFSSALIRRLKALPDGILVNSLQKTVSYNLKEGDVLVTLDNDTVSDENEHLLAVDIPIEVIYEDEGITVVNKPSGMPTHQSLGNYDNSLANALKFRYKDKPYVFRAVNRLDKNTSGIVITANNKYYASLISKKIKEGAVKKEYIAVVNGCVDRAGTVDAPIKREQESIITRIVSEDGERAITHYEPLLACKEMSVLRVTPVTGRTHQIRVHMKHISHPIVGDSLYGEKSELIERQALHCAKMEIFGIGEYIAPIPADMKALIRRYFKNEEILF